MAFALACAVACIAACQAAPSIAPTPRTGTAVSASFGKTWDAVIDAFAARSISIKAVDRASGLIAADMQSVSGDDTGSLADCGTLFGMPLNPQHAVWNVLVRGDSAHATVRASVRFTNLDNDCVSKGLWESAFEEGIAAHAEGRAPPR